jgi:hypothetical protein
MRNDASGTSIVRANLKHDNVTAVSTCYVHVKTLRVAASRHVMCI